jgi:hypothetical protein
MIDTLLRWCSHVCQRLLNALVRSPVVMVEGGARTQECQKAMGCREDLVG